MSEIIGAPGYFCPKCKQEFPSGTLFETRQENDLTINYHRVKSSISGGGSRLCGPVEEKDENS